MALLLVTILTVPHTFPLSLWQDNFGYGETAMGTVFALNGVAVGLLQVRATSPPHPKPTILDTRRLVA